jgi:hypothetical protein
MCVRGYPNAGQITTSRQVIHFINCFYVKVPANDVHKSKYKHENFKTILNLRSACNHSVQHLSSSGLLSKL